MFENNPVLLRSRLQLKNVQHNERLSEGTACFSATLYVDGKRAMAVSNRGIGGPTDFNPADAKTSYAAVRKQQEELDAWLKANFPAEKFGGMTLEPDLEHAVLNLLDRHLLSKNLKRHLKKSIVIVQSGKRGVLALNLGGAYDSACHDSVVLHRYPGATILNSLPYEEALDLFVANVESA